MKPAVETVMEKLAQMSNESAESSAETRGIFGMDSLRVLEIPHERLRALAEEIGVPNQPLAVSLWRSDLYEAKILACILADPSAFSEESIEEWASGVTSWVIGDYCCCEMIWKTPFAKKKAAEWAESPDDWRIRAGFSLISALAYRVPAGDPDELGFFDRSLFIARKQASRSENNIPKAVSSAIGAIGTRSEDWHEAAVETCEEIAMQPSETAKWVASQALGDLMSSEIGKALRE